MTAIRIFLVLAALLISAVAGVFVLLGGPQSLRWRHHFEHLVKTNDHRAVATAAINVIQAATNDEYLSSAQLSNLPRPITAMAPRSVFVSPNRLMIEFHGGFDHFGFQVLGQSNSWEMTWYTEAGHHPILVLARETEDEPSRAPKTTNSPSGFQPNRSTTPDGARR